MPRDEIEGSFEDVLKSLQPTTQLFAISKAMIKDAWNMLEQVQAHTTG